MARPCGQCAFENPPDHNFCGRCGRPLLRVEEETASATEEPEGERRQLTLLFCDIVASTALAGRLDPEELHGVLRAYQEVCAEAVQRLDGTVAQYLGDGVLVYFGYPRAHEDDPMRAVSAALTILDELPGLNARVARRVPALRDRPLQLRIGIHTGPVVVGDMGVGERQERLALGGTANLAARLEKLAEPDTAVISAATQRLVSGVFVVEDLGLKALSGVKQPVGAYRVLRASGVHDRLSLAETAGLSPLVGREQEVALVLDRWEQVKEGRGQAMLLSGEPGMGKSRLIRVIRERLTAEKHSWLELRCSPYHSASDFFPVVDLLLAGLFIDPQDSDETRIQKLERALAPTGLPLEESLPTIASLLSIPLPEGYETRPVAPETRRHQTLETLAAWLFSLSEQQPAVLVVEDLHWIDPSTLELLGLLLEQAPTARVLLLLSFRPGFRSPWTDRSHVVQLNLHPLTRRQMGTMVEALAGGRRLPAAVAAQILARADGVPLFVEELAKTVLESDHLEEREGRLELRGPQGGLAIPSTLQDSLMARLDRLGQTKELAQLAAVLGREFSHELLAAVSPLSEEHLEHELEQLARAELVYRRGVPPRATYSFKHALIQETAYASLLRSRRQEFHRQIAEVLEKEFPERARARPEEVAHHYADAGLLQPAVALYRRAGEQATQRSAHREAIEHLSRGVELLRELPESAERNRQELPLQVALGAPMIGALGQGAPEVERVYERARELCHALGDAPELFPTLWGLARFYQVQGRIEAAFEIDEQLLAMAESAGDPSWRLWAHLSVGLACFWRGEPARSLHHLEHCMALYRPELHAEQRAVFGQDPEVSSRSLGGAALWLLGRAETGLAMCQDAVARGRASGHPLSMAFALSFASAMHQMRRERAAAGELAEETVAVSARSGLPLWHGFGRMMRGWAWSGSHAGGLEELRQGLDEFSQVGLGVGGGYRLALLAEAYRSAGRRAEALQALDEALEVAEHQQSPFWNTEVLRLRGEMRLADGPAAAPEAERLYRQALELARRQGALALELRTATSYALLLRDRGETAAARELLAPLYARFQEGFDTFDLREAKELLAQLA